MKIKGQKHVYYWNTLWLTPISDKTSVGQTEILGVLTAYREGQIWFLVRQVGILFR